MQPKSLLLMLGMALVAVPGAVPAAEGDPAQGARVFRTCAACHSLERGAHRTGPSLAGIVGRPAGTVEGFTRYSEALRHAGLTWDAATLDAWLADPQALVPGNRMTFPGIPDAQARADLVAYLEAAASEAGPGRAPREGEPAMGGMMRGVPRS